MLQYVLSPLEALNTLWWDSWLTYPIYKILMTDIFGIPTYQAPVLLYDEVWRHTSLWRQHHYRMLTKLLNMLSHTAPSTPTITYGHILYILKKEKAGKTEKNIGLMCHHVLSWHWTRLSNSYWMTHRSCKKFDFQRCTEKIWILLQLATIGVITRLKSLYLYLHS